jgi:exopolysaccharide biosynthesis WecB/TagA/CpsF family protein
MNIIDKKIICGSSFSTIIFNNKSKLLKTISFVNPYSYMVMKENVNLVDDIDYFFVDGSLLCRFHSFFFSKVKRASFDFSSMADSFFSSCIDNNFRVAIVGAQEDENTKAVYNIKLRYPKLNIIYNRDGYINSRKDEISNLNDILIDVLIVGMGCPHQEFFLSDLKKTKTNIKIAITCGGFISQTALKSDYYHPLIKITGARWLQRMIMHKHVRNRVLYDYPKFLFHYFRENIIR